ncbi:granulocyte-macrophage colony-stimulating factor receptor subunit alpha-like [Pseudophryne corroboree]|uniref:granulocyte-macrophage colony-stimulating factor receptor subunit alpha-like n=1 Tax=Pseudophryne corroboree TaxID=495146 RepID=UPI003081D609
MDSKILITSYWIIWQCCSWHLYSKECNSTTLPYHRANLSVKTNGSHIFLFWDCDVHRIYEIHMKTSEGQWEYLTEDLQNVSQLDQSNVDLQNVSQLDQSNVISVQQETKCSKEIPLKQLKKAPPLICLKVIPFLDSNECEHLSSEICGKFGRNGTLAENISCSVYNTSMICKWMFGTYVQQNAMYKLSLIQNNLIQQNNQQYEYDQKKRTGSCILHDLKLNFFIDVTIIFEVHGLERQEYWFKPAAQEIFNPPTNIKLLCSLEDTEIHWNVPHTQYNVTDECFEYMIEMNKEHYKTTNNTYTIPIMENKRSVRIRARGKQLCQMNTNWGQWSEEKVCDIKQDKKTLDATIISVIVVSGLIIVLFIISTVHYKRIYNVCFPPIPKPKNYFDWTQDGKINIEENIYVAAILPTFETEEYITLPEIM